MKPTILFLLALGTVVTTSAAEMPPATASEVTAATVFLDRALVERTATITLAEGETTIRLRELPANLLDDSLQVSGLGPAGTTVLDVQSRNIFLETEPSPDLRPLEDALAALMRDQRSLDDEQAALELDQILLDRITAASTTLPTEGDAPRPAVDDWQQLLSFNAREIRRIKSGHRDLAHQQEGLTARIAAAERQLNEARGRRSGRRAVKEVTVRMAAETSGPGQLTVSYFVPGAEWTPVYHARVDSTNRRVALDYQAQVVNRTGEAWHDIALTLSTARPSAGGSAPTPPPWIVEERKAPKTRRGEEVFELSPFTVSSGNSRPRTAARRYPPPAATQEFRQEAAAVDAGLTSATFHISAPATIPADGTTQQVFITTLDLAAEFRFDTTPKLQTAAFLTAVVRNDSDYPLLPGSLAAFVDGAFIAKSHLSATITNEEFDLALGVDEAVAVERTLVNRFVEKTGFTNNSYRVTYEIALKLTNHKSVPVALELSEPLPVSRHEKIDVKMLEPPVRQIGGPDDATAFQRDERGILIWSGSLAAGDIRDLTLEFSIEFPNTMRVSGVE